MNKLQSKRCPVCRKWYEVASNRVNHGRIKSVRGKRMMTCSKPCSKIYSDCIKAYKTRLKMEEVARDKKMMELTIKRILIGEDIWERLAQKEEEEQKVARE